MDLQLGLSLSTPFDSDHDLFTSFSVSHKKRSFSDLLHHDCLRDRDGDGDVLLPTLPLLPLTPSHEADLDDEDLRNSCSIVTKHDGDDGGESSAAVGWPPLMSQRKKVRVEEDGMAEIRQYVKVKMEGEGIGRKVDLSLHHSFQKLKETLMAMFGKCHQNSECYELAYQDKEGDWLLAEDLPWKDFLQCAQRLTLLKRTS
ncbi:auxin-responsive protein IAA5-like [Neltuma alba]|uniref:auxin-responsive protein IAA5-like n=1 Tax=Neltuma alba TaxID=207710 RepID=UPI0010A502AA|nr:auxin-responsive protein IAA5-like [Prosopis alba]